MTKCPKNCFDITGNCRVVFLAHFLRISISAYSSSCVCSKSWPQLKKISIFHTLGRPGPDFVILGYQTIWRPLKVVKWTQKWKSMWKSYIVSILDFIVKKFLLVIFWTLCSENWPFLDNFDQNLFLVKSMKHFNKNCPKINSQLNFEPFL